MSERRSPTVPGEVWIFVNNLKDPQNLFWSVRKRERDGSLSVYLSEAVSIRGRADSRSEGPSGPQPRLFFVMRGDCQRDGNCIVVTSEGGVTDAESSS